MTQAVSDDVIREVFLAHGFTIKEGQTDLKPYVFKAAHALIERVSPAGQASGEPVATYLGESYAGSLIELLDVIAVGTKLYTAPQQQAGGEVVAWMSEKDLVSLKAKTVWRPLLSTFKPKNDGEVLLYTAPPSTSALVEALEKIERWFGEFPESGRFFDEPDNTRPMSYGVAFGSNGERDYMRSIARAALAAHRKETA